MSPDEDKSISTTVLPDGQDYRDTLLQLIEQPSATLDALGQITAVNGQLEKLFPGRAAALVGGSVVDLLGDAGVRVVDALAGDGIEFSALPVDALPGAPTMRMRLQPISDDTGAKVGWIMMLLSARADAQGAERRFDPLTDLPDCDFLRARITQALLDKNAPERQVAVLCIDLDGFKTVNIEHGRAVGDKVLIETARRIAGSMRATNTVGRLLEDSFAVVVPGIRSEEQVTAVASRLISNVSAPFEVKGTRDPIHLSASVGIALAPENSGDADELLVFAQSAVDLAKRSGRGTYQFYTNRTSGEMRERRSMVNKLRRGIEEDQLLLRYHPKVSLATNTIVGAEALVRWQDPESGLIMPANFIPLAEDAGLIDPIGRRVLAEACQATRKWQDDGLPFLRIAVNVSAHQIARRSFFTDMLAVLDEAGLEPDALELEITESAVMNGAEDIIRTLRDIRVTGVHLTADDFGTGYASLSYLRNFPLDCIKIDTTFVADIVDADNNQSGLAAAVVAVGHCLGMNVVAEGVETRQQLDYLRWHGCDEVQGYLISQPLNADEFAEMVEKGPVF